MSKLLVIYGATGQQGGSVLDHVLTSPSLATQFKIRAVTRNPSSKSAQALEHRGVEVVKGDVSDKESIKSALKGAHTVFAMTNTIYDRNGGKEREVEQGKAIADEAVAAGADFIIWSSMSHPSKLSKGKNRNVPHFDSKAEVEEHIRTLPIKAAYFAPGGYMQNFHSEMAPIPNGDGTYSFTSVVNPDTPLPFIEIAADTGKFVGAILEEPDKYNGKVFAAAERCYTYPEAAEIISKATGKTVTYTQVPDDVFKGFLPPHFDAETLGMMQHMRDELYYGENTVADVEWAAKQARGKLTSLEEYLQSSPLKLE